MATWKEDIVKALENLGGKAHLSEIYKEVEKIRPLELNNTWDRTKELVKKKAIRITSSF